MTLDELKAELEIARANLIIAQSKLDDMKMNINVMQELLNEV